MQIVPCVDHYPYFACDIYQPIVGLFDDQFARTWLLAQVPVDGEGVHHSQVPLHRQGQRRVDRTHLHSLHWVILEKRGLQNQWQN